MWTIYFQFLGRVFRSVETVLNQIVLAAEHDTVDQTGAKKRGKRLKQSHNLPK